MSHVYVTNLGTKYIDYIINYYALSLETVGVHVAVHTKWLLP